MSYNRNEETMIYMWKSDSNSDGVSSLVVIPWNSGKQFYIGVPQIYHNLLNALRGNYSYITAF